MEIVTLGLSLSDTAGTEVIWEGRIENRHPLTPCGAVMISWTGVGTEDEGASVRAELESDGVQRGR